MILRDRTAIRRTTFSKPISRALKDGIISSSTELFDYGCGFGDDVRHLGETGISATGWDPNHDPASPKQAADIVNLGYVINVVEQVEERRALIREAWSFARRVLIVAARLKSECEADLREHEDGYVTRLQTFQKFYDQRELAEWIADVIREKPIAAAPGVFYVFRDEQQREEFIASRFRQPFAAPRVRLSDKLFNEHEGKLSEVMAFVTDRGRLPQSDEIVAGAAILDAFGSIGRAFQVITRVTGKEQWRTIAKERRTDLLVYLALGRFPRRPKFSSVPQSLQCDIRSFFATYNRACNEADVLLFSAGNMESIDAMCRQAQFGKLMPTALYVHRFGLDRLPPLLRVYEGCARVLSGVVDGTTLIKFGRHEPKISYLAYPSFDDDAHPALIASVRVALRSLDLKYRDFLGSADAPILHRKEEFVPEDYPDRAKFVNLTRAENSAGLYCNPEAIGSRERWASLLDARGFRILGHSLLPVAT